jgi:hypothetical protein
VRITDSYGEHGPWRPGELVLRVPVPREPLAGREGELAEDHGPDALSF